MTGDEWDDRQARGGWADTDLAPVGSDGHHLTESGNADRLVAHHGAELRYEPLWRSWLVWDGIVWQVDHGDLGVTEKAKDTNRRLWAGAAEMPASKDRDRQVAWAKTSEKANVIANTIRLARGIPGVAIDHTGFDPDPMLLNTVNGMVDLATGDLSAHDPERLCTKRAGTYYDPEATCPTWHRFIGRILPDDNLRAFVQRAVGYTLTGLTGEQVMFLLIGDGSNGKSVLVETIARALGTYAGVVAKDLLIAQRHDAHPTSAADLFRLRFASAVETEATNVLAEARVKSLTGSDTIKARRLYEDHWSFSPTHKIFLAANHLPRVTGTDHGIWRRLRVVPFTVTIGDDERDPHLVDKLTAELPGILAWAVEGCLAWQRDGLAVPDVVTAATDTYRLESDWFGRWLEDENFTLEPGRSALAGDLNRSYQNWARTNGEDAISTTALGKELRRRGCQDKRSNSARMWRGIGRSDAP